MEVLERPCGVPRGSSEFQRMASRGSAAGRGSVAKVQLSSAEAPSLPCADAVAAAAAAAAATAFAATVSAAAAVPALPPGASIVPAVSGPEARPPSGFRNGRRPTELRHQGAGGTGSGRGQRGNPGEPGAERGAAGSRGGEVCGLRSWGFLSPARLSPPASPSGVGAPAGAPGDEPGLEVAGLEKLGQYLTKLGFLGAGAICCHYSPRNIGEEEEGKALRTVVELNVPRLS
ncbi:unnamed protein product [Nyctereutes procyonoides]|uniref:(raccoon dog) hypothetical protein n=1 Tax=Nyctereutes procyonoides TaxID=34880 RepID=A0A811Z6Q4_NYCPR|nr:unnamed protein product [Nyctereutes procyonoides]